MSGTRGRAVKTVTLKALLTPGALAHLDAGAAFQFCADPACEVVYFSAQQTYATTDLKGPVFQKAPESVVPVCYCFGHTRAEVRHAAETGSGETLLETITGHIQAGRCGCEVNNPQGSCCLGNVRAVLRSASHLASPAP
ncbi:hypothetical protein HNQ07_004538 [Deinococcus metalli]|uniref:CopZ zinc binding domain-containing protein n=1 Tax=Deinococcus metalli TaxID=1141878 RepID=A0A7W8KKP3_9DEIO|nr:(2Fe-2S)-binding protein [Deinococcus metalli]MBB5379028.1 hypothetical protein [Deinococcus metalli]